MAATLHPGEMRPLHDTIGAMFIGVIASGVLHGISLVQAFYYFSSYPKDLLYIKGLVTITLLFDATHLCMVSHTIYHYVISNYYDKQAIGLLVWSVLLEALFTGVNGALVQTFFTLRVFRLSNKNYYLSAFILMLIVSTAGCGTVWVILSMQMKTYEELLRISPLTITINALSCSVDILIAGSLCFLLNRARTGFKHSDSMINRLMLFVVNTGVLTTVCAIASLIALIASPNTLIYATFYFCIGRLYTNSLLATLNARQSIRSGVDNCSHPMVSLPPSVLSPGGTVITTSKNTKSQQGLAIRIDTTQERDQESNQTRSVGYPGDAGNRSEDDFSDKKQHPLQ